MTDQPREPKLVRRAEALLAQGQLKEPDFEALALRVGAALGTAGPSDDALLLPPLPESIDDDRLPLADTPSPTAVSPAAPSDGASLAELARAAVARRDSKEKVSLAEESLAMASRRRAAAAPLPVRPAPAAPEFESDRRTVPPARRARPAFDARGPWIGVAIAAAGLAAGFGLYLSGRGRTELIEVPVAERAPLAMPASSATVATESGPAAPRVTPDMLPAERAKPAPEATSAPDPAATDALARGSTPGKPSASGSDARPATAEARAPAPSAPAKAEKVVLDEEQPPGTPAPAAPSKPGSTPGLKPAELNANGGGISDRPSTGAAQAAVGAVLGAARSCIAGQPQASSATLVFGSSGEVTGVSVSGPAEGTPAAACIQGALKKARLQPFAAASFSLGVTVRPP